VTASGCWEWTGGRYPRGYGYLRNFEFGDAGGRCLAHRWAWGVERGAIPKGMVVMHACDNPPCVNPAHLRLGTQADNYRDAMMKGRIRWVERLGDEVLCPRGHAADWARTKRGYRVCRVCRRERVAEFYLRHPRGKKGSASGVTIRNG
jgi:hypothetical protein